MSMKLHEKNGLHWLESSLFTGNPHLQQATFLRHGGVSEGPFSSLNVSFHPSENAENVSENIQRVMDVLAVPKLVWGNQVHGIHVEEVSSSTIAPVMDCDALMTNEPNVGLMIQHADCQAVVMYDPVHNAIANVHVGWRGNVQGILETVINKMAQRYGSRPEDLLVSISPSLGPDASQFINYRTEFPESFWKHEHKPLYFDLWAISNMQLTSCGVLPAHIECARQCTYSDPSRFFSYRREKVRGCHGTIVRLR